VFLLRCAKAQLCSTIRQFAQCYLILAHIRHTVYICITRSLFNVGNASPFACLHVCAHRCRSMHIFGGANNFCPNFCKLVRKTSKQKFCKNKNKKEKLNFTGRKAFQAPFFRNVTQTFQTCRKTTKFKHGRNFVAKCGGHSLV